MERSPGSVWSTVFNGILATCAVLVTALLLRSELIGLRGRPTSQPSTASIEPQKDWEQYFTRGQRLGPVGAGLALVIFSDYQCPACRTLNEQLREYREDSVYRVAVLFRHWPLPQHPFARPAAIASECAAAQGRFEQMHDSLFANQEKLGVLPWEQLAASAGVTDLQAFTRCMSSDIVQSEVEADAYAAKRLAARGTPAVVVVGGSQFAGVPSKRVVDSLLSAVSGRLQKATMK